MNSRRFYSLDVLRGLAALSVVLWHWQNFFGNGINAAALDPLRLPLFDWLSLLYTHGAWAVHLFFCLSGFVFYWLYASAVAEGEIAAGKFAWLRFSRLYPLHVATLLVVTAGQLCMLRAHGSYFVLAHNDAGHFVLNLLLASSWGLERGYSFNGPAWSVSVEVLLYAVFFACCRFLPVRGTLLALLAVLGFAVLTAVYPPLGWGIGSFFAGGCVFLAYRRILALPDPRYATAWVVCLAGATWLLTWLAAQPVLDPAWRYFAPALPEDAALFWTTITLYPLTILSLALIETHRGSLGKRLAFLGNISYSVYLLHFPLQLWTVLLAARLGLSPAMYYSVWFLGLFFAGLILLSMASYRYFELPVQQALRRQLLLRPDPSR